MAPILQTQAVNLGFECTASDCTDRPAFRALPFPKDNGTRGFSIFASNSVGGEHLYEPIRIQKSNRTHLVHASAPLFLHDSVLCVCSVLKCFESESNIQQPTTPLYPTALSGLLYLGTCSAFTGISS